jgi:transposase
MSAQPSPIGQLFDYQVQVYEQPIITREEMERRRLAGAEELKQGISQGAVARHFQVSRTTASRWQKVLRQGQSLKRRRPTGRPPGLGSEQRQKAVEAWEFGGSALGYGKWTCRSFAKFIADKFGVKYDEDHVGRLIIKWGLRERRPRKKAVAA